MPSPLTSLQKAERETLLDDLNYLNLSEIKQFCKKHSIPFAIHVETGDGSKKKTSDTDRKGMILNRMHHYLKTGEVLPATCFQASVVCFGELPKNLKPTDRLYYGQYNKKNKKLMTFLGELTGDKFKDGAVARVLLAEYWTDGMAPTLQEFAKKWFQITADPGKPAPEYAYLSDRASRKKIDNWKEYRSEKARKIISVLNKL